MRIRENLHIIESHRWRHNPDMPVRCNYQNCDRLITNYPLVSKDGHAGHHHYYHIKCAKVLRIL